MHYRYGDGIKLFGVIYLHEITHPRTFEAHKHVKMFHRLSGNAATNNVIFATTKWDEVQTKVGEASESQLIDLHWKHVDPELRMLRLNGSAELAMEAIKQLIASAHQPSDDNVVTTATNPCYIRSNNGSLASKIWFRTSVSLWLIDIHDSISSQSLSNISLTGAGSRAPQPARRNPAPN